VEAGETLRGALAREILEETGWHLADVVTSVARVDWATEQAGLMVRKREFDFVVTVNGDLEQPQLERDKVTEYRWVGASDVDLLEENRQPSDSVVADLVRSALALISAH
jgi:8-oxo-dGTP pyrophosphatase MutT (NUDIX family)